MNTSYELEEPFPEEEKPSALKKILVIFLGIFLLALIVSYYLFADTISGIIGSSVVKDNTLVSGNTTIRFENGTFEKLQTEYFGNQQREIKACLFGTTSGQEYDVSGIIFPEVISANVEQIESIACPNGTLIDLHSHPINQCLASDVDVNNFRSLKRQNPDILMVIMCSPTRFAVYASAG